MENYKRLIKFVFPHAWVLALAGLCMVISSAFGGVSIGMIIPLVDNIITGKKIIVPHNVSLPPAVKGLIDLANSLTPLQLLNDMILIVIVLWLLKSFFEFCQTYLMNDVAQNNNEQHKLNILLQQ